MIKNETYLISYESGSCGTFLGYILQQILAQDHIAYQKILEFPKSHAHDIDFWKDKHLDYKNFYTFLSNHSNGVYSYKTANYATHDKPLIYRDHLAPDWDLFFSKFINGKNLVITFSEKMAIYVATFRWKKLFFENNKSTDLNIDVWFVHVDKFPFSYKDPLVIPEKYNDKIIEIKVEDLLFNKEKILNTLSSITNKPIPHFVDKSYDNYLLAQKQHYPHLFD